jgi:hypothetical protein
VINAHPSGLKNFKIIGGEGSEHIDVGREALMAEARSQVKVRKLQKKDMIIDGYF